MINTTPLLRIGDLRVCYQTNGRRDWAVDGLDLTIGSGQTVALVGESGCGKTTVAHAILGLLGPPQAEVAEGLIELAGTDLRGLDEHDMRRIRGAKIGLVFQRPADALNPVLTCGRQIVEGLELHGKASGSGRRALAVEMLGKVGVDSPVRCFDRYPHQLSGGQRQRVMLAMALICQPQLLIADEPTAALDAATERQVLDLLAMLQAESDLSILLISHDLPMVARIAHTVGVMYMGRLAELAPTAEAFGHPLHPYSRGLQASAPQLGRTRSHLTAIPGTAPSLAASPPGCPFHPRCALGRDRPQCRQDRPELREVAPNHWCACWACPGYDAPLASPGDPKPGQSEGLAP